MKSKGFTLIEAVVVFVIVLILVGVLAFFALVLRALWKVGSNPVIGPACISEIQ